MLRSTQSVCRRALLLTLALVSSDTVSLTKCSCQEGPRDSVREALALLNACPNWSKLTHMDEAARARVAEAMKQLDEYPTDGLRAAVREYVRQNSDPRTADDWLFARVLALNRYIFNVPEKFPKKWKPFGAFFLAMPGDEAPYLAPWKKDAQGSLCLVGELLAYIGPPYRALEEFDYFAARFGRRTHRLRSPQAR
jgi:hypothetical protein